MDAQRKLWNEQQGRLRAALSNPDEHTLAIECFLSQHAMVHSARVAQTAGPSFEDEIWEGLSEAAARHIPPKSDHSIAWVIWHIARIEDVTMNMLVAGSQQVLHRDDWLERMKTTARDTGNLMEPEGVAELSARIDLDTLRAYRIAVGRRTREIVRQLRPEELKKKVEAGRLKRIIAEGAVLPAANDLIDYWGGLTIAGLLLMPPTRHNFVHLNEALRLKRKSR